MDVCIDGDRPPSIAAIAESVQSLRKARGARCGSVAIIAIDGPSGSGKTTLAAELAGALRAAVLHLDDMYQGWEGLAETVELAQDSLVRAWRLGVPARQPSWDWTANVATGYRDAPSPAVVILEGVGAFAVAGDEACVRIWVEAAPATRKRRALARDGDTFAANWDLWAEQERSLYTSHRAYQRQLPLVVLAAAVIAVALNLRTVMAGLPPLLPQISRDLQLGPTAMGALTALPVLCMGLLAPGAAALGHKLGPVRTVTIAMVALVVGNLLRAVAPTVGGLYLGTVCAGVGVALAGTVLPGLVKTYFPRRRAGLATGLQMMAMMTGAGISAALAVPLSRLWGGWAPSLGFWGVIAAGGLLCWVAFDHAVSRGPSPRHHLKRAAPHATARSRMPGRSTTAWLLATYLTVQSWHFYSGLAWLSPTYVERGWDAGRAGLLLSVFTGAQLISGLIAPAITDRVADWRSVLVSAAALSLGGELGIWLAPDAAPWLWALVLGGGQGAAFALGLVLLVRYAQSAAAASRLTAMAFLVSYTLAAGGPAAMGAVREITGGFAALWMALSVAAIPQVMLAWMLHPQRPQVR